LTPEQQQALADLLTSVVPIVATAGNGLPAAAFSSLAKEAGSLVVSPSPVAAAVDGAPAPASLPAELAALLALLAPWQPATNAAEVPDPSTSAEASGPEPEALAAGLGSLLALLGAPLMPPGGRGNGKVAPAPEGARTQPPLAAVVAQLHEGLQSGTDAAATAAASAVSNRDALPPVGFLLALRAAAAQAPDAVGVEPSGHAADLVGDLAEAASIADARAATGHLAETSPVRPRAVETVAVPFGDRGWERALGEKVVWLVGQQMQAAEVKLNPPHLGPVEFRLTLNGNEASVSFTAANAVVRDAIEQALPRLREMLAEQNVVMVDVNVGQRGGSGQAEQREDRAQVAGTPGAVPGRDGEAPASELPLRRMSASGLVDEYA
jgi:flagellar hook-length control protein FliK